MTQKNTINPHDNGHILVAEDDHVVQLVLKNMLIKAGYRVDCVDDGCQAVNALELKQYDLVVMDCLMPKMDGFAATRRIRSTNSRVNNHGVPIIALTGLSGDDDHARCYDAGVNVCVNKPVNPDSFMPIVRQCLGQTEVVSSGSQQNQTCNNQFWDDESLDRMIDVFLADTPGLLAALEQAGEQGDAGKLQRLGHRLRGTADILGTRTLSARAHALEQAGKAGDLKRAGELTTTLVDELHKLTSVLAV